MSVSDVAQMLKDEYDEAVSSLSIEEAIEVAEELQSFLSAALDGLRDDLEAQS